MFFICCCCCLHPFQVGYRKWISHFEHVINNRKCYNLLTIHDRCVKYVCDSKAYEVLQRHMLKLNANGNPANHRKICGRKNRRRRRNNLAIICKTNKTKYTYTYDIIFYLLTEMISWYCICYHRN